MQIDGRHIHIEETLKAMKTALSICRELGPGLNVLVNGREEALKVKAFASMSGLKTEIIHEQGHLRAVITGDPCGCGC